MRQLFGLFLQQMVGQIKCRPITRVFPSLGPKLGSRKDNALFRERETCRLGPLEVIPTKCVRRLFAAALTPKGAEEGIGRGKQDQGRRQGGGDGGSLEGQQSLPNKESDRGQPLKDILLSPPLLRSKGGFNALVPKASS